MRLLPWLLAGGLWCFGSTAAHAQAAHHSASSAVFTLTMPGAVLFRPGPAKVAQLKRTYGEEDFYTMADDGQTYTAQAREYLRAQGVKTVETDATMLRFVETGGATHQVKLEPTHTWGLLLFDGRSAPRFADLTSPPEAVQAMFRRP